MSYIFYNQKQESQDLQECDSSKLKQNVKSKLKWSTQTFVELHCANFFIHCRLLITGVAETDKEQIFGTDSFHTKSSKYLEIH